MKTNTIRDGRPVAKLVRHVPEQPQRKRWTSKEHMRWMKKVWGKKVLIRSDEALARDRADQWEQFKK